MIEIPEDIYLQISDECDTRSFVFCPECKKILYKMPVTRVEGIYARVANNTMYGHSQFLYGHNPLIIFKQIQINENHE